MQLQRLRNERATPLKLVVRYVPVAAEPGGSTALRIVAAPHIDVALDTLPRQCLRCVRLPMPANHIRCSQPSTTSAASAR